MSIAAHRIEDVYRRRHQAFGNAVACLTGNRDSAVDVVQEAFARALARREQFRGDGSLEAWIWRIAIRTALEQSWQIPDLRTRSAIQSLRLRSASYRHADD